LLDSGLPDGEVEGLVAVIPAAEIARLKEFGHCYLRNLLSISENSELGLAGQYFLSR